MRTRYFSALLLFSLLFSCSKTVPSAINRLFENFSTKQRNLIFDEAAKQSMRVLKINNLKDSLLLRSNSESIRFPLDQKVLEHFSSRLLATVLDSNSMGVGIAAPQVGILKRMILVQRFDKKNLPFEFYLNPSIKQFSNKKQACKEGCLSIPGRSDTTQTRAYAILIEYDKMDGTHHYEMVEGFTAVIFQHEIDHLDGILYLDHLAEESRAARKP